MNIFSLNVGPSSLGRRSKKLNFFGVGIYQDALDIVITKSFACIMHFLNSPTFALNDWTTMAGAI